MRRILAWVVFGLLLPGAGIVRAPIAAIAQGQDQKADELLRLLERIEQVQEPEERIALGDQALKVESELGLWGLPSDRDVLRAGLWIVLGEGYQQRTLGDKADNQEKVITAFETALAIVSLRDADRQAWADTQNQLGFAYQTRTRGDPAENQDKAVAAYEAVLTVFSRETEPRTWAQAQYNLAVAYRYRTHGDRGDNLDKAIAAYEAALTGFRPSSDPGVWVKAQNDLGVAYTSRTRGNRADNIEKAIAAFGATLDVATREWLRTEWAVAQIGLGAAYTQRINGERADNLEKAITAYTAALTSVEKDVHPSAWSDTQNKLAIAYEERIRGDRADNVEKAIAAYEQSLTVRTREALPREWSDTQYNLGATYRARMKGDRADNLEKAIDAYQRALTVMTRDALPQEWAKTHHNLAFVYRDRIRGDPADNRDKAIDALKGALTVFSRAVHPREWAQVQDGLAGAYVDRIREDRADNLEKAIAAYEQALTVTTREADPLRWAEIQNNLATAYQHRVHGARERNIDNAIAAYTSAATIITRKAAPIKWATIQSNLGAAYIERSKGEPAANLETAIATLQAAIAVRTREALPDEWAATQRTLGNAYFYRIDGDRAENIERAIAAYAAALEVRTREKSPREWADTHHSLGLAYRERVRGDRADNLKKAVSAFEAALTIITRKALPRQHMSTAQSLAGTLLEAGRWHEAGLAAASAREAFLVLFGQGLNDADARWLTAAARSISSDAAYAAAQLGENDKALALAVEGRARLVAVALRLQMLDLQAEKRKRLDELRADIRIADREVEVTQGAARADAVEKLASLREEVRALVSEAHRGGGDAESSLAQVRAVVPNGGAVVTPIVTRLGGKLLIVTVRSDAVAQRERRAKPAKSGADATQTASTYAGTESLSSVAVVDVPELMEGKLNTLILGDKNENRRGGWLYAYLINYITDEKERDRRWPEWQAAIGNIGPRLWELIGARLDAALKEAGVGPGARLVWLPTSALGILPLGLAQDPASKRRLGDDYEIVYAPSLEALTAAQRQIAKTAPTTLAAVVNPTGGIKGWDLPGAAYEGKLVASHFPGKARTVLVGPAAKPDAVLAALKEKSYWHFATHGAFSWEDARQSGLYLSERKLLSVGTLLQADGLGRPRLVVLSACETGLYDISRNPDEFIGLPGTFTALGAAGVLGTLWPVADTATALLIAKFYELHLGRHVAPPTALRRAQLWLRQASNVELIAYARVAASQGRLDKSHVAEIAEELSEIGLRRSRKAPPAEWATAKPPPAAEKEHPAGKRTAHAGARVARPYVHPYYWAGFIYTGL